jgi:hypothetical protein
MQERTRIAVKDFIAKNPIAIGKDTLLSSELRSAWAKTLPPRQETNLIDLIKSRMN